VTRTDDDGNPFAGRSIIDLEAERAQLEDELERTRGLAVRSLAIEPMQERLEELCAEIARTGQSA
jgi:hypothetical protein